MHKRANEHKILVIFEKLYKDDKECYIRICHSDPNYLLRLADNFDKEGFDIKYWHREAERLRNMVLKVAKRQKHKKGGEAM